MDILSPLVRECHPPLHLPSLHKFTISDNTSKGDVHETQNRFDQMGERGVFLGGRFSRRECSPPGRTTNPRVDTTVLRVLTLSLGRRSEMCDTLEFVEWIEETRGRRSRYFVVITTVG